SISQLSDAVGWEGFEAKTVVENNVSIGYCHHPQRMPKAGIYIDDNIIVLADIRIYNLEELHQKFDFNLPEEALAKAFLKWGTDCGNYINGDYAAAIYDRNNRQLFLLRDHIGTRPLVYCRSGSTVFFASHEFGLAKSGLYHTALSEKKLIDTFFQLKRIYAQTDFKSIKKVIPGHGITFSENAVAIHKYWKPELIKKNNSLTFGSAVQNLREKIIFATINRMEQVNTGLHVSGGIDSCGIASIVADHTSDHSRLIGYSWTPEVFEDTADGVNEKEFIEAFSTDKKVGVKYQNLDEYETVKNSILPEFSITHIEHPIMQTAEQDQIEVMFSGWGGDEFVSLSMRGIVNHLFFKLKWKTLLEYCKVRGIKTTLYQLRTDVIPFLIPFGLMPVYKAQRTDLSVLTLFKPLFIKKHLRQILSHKKSKVFGYGDRNKFVLNLLNLHHLPERMESWAINAERYGFEYKYPLLDKDALEFWFSIPVKFTYQNFESRLLYRDAMKGILTEKIRIRKDKGEAVRIAFSDREKQNGRSYLENLFYSLPPQNHLPYFNIKALKKVFSQPYKKGSLKSIKNVNKCTFYLRYVELVKNYRE
ncbi:MAG: asparagine synthase-related protein, partial [Bacteroidales bacterium]|nr:asparagine synthase-related protein [Bacteroidales bacterium]